MPFLVISRHRDNEIFTVKDKHRILFTLNLSLIRNIGIEAWGRDDDNNPFMKHCINFSYHDGLDYNMCLIEK